VTLAAVEFAQRHGTRVQIAHVGDKLSTDVCVQALGQEFYPTSGRDRVLSPWLTLAHMVWIEEEDLPLLAEHSVGVAHNPSSNLRLRSGVAPIPAMLERRDTGGRRSGRASAGR